MDLSRIENFQDAIVTVMGLGRYKQGSGLGAAKWLIRHGAQTIITDLKDESELEESMVLVTEWYEKYRTMYPHRTIYQPVFVLGEHRKEDFTDVACVVQNPGVPSESEFIQAAKEHGVSIESDVSLFFRFCPYPIIAVTGTKGKTTTTKIIGEMLEKRDAKTVVAGNIKVSPLEMLDEVLVRGEPTLVVLELSSWLLESLPPAFIDLKKGPDISILTNVYPDHLNRYPSYGDYIHSKEIIFLNQTSDQYTILNWDHETVRSMEPEVKGHLFWCSKTDQPHDGCFVKDGQVIVRLGDVEEAVIALPEIALKGDHNLENILAATCAARLRGIPLDLVREVLKTFQGVSDRQELVREVDEISYVNDTTATNPDAVIAALKRFGADGDIILVAGGVDKKMEYKPMVEEVVKTCKHLVLFDGDASDLIASAVGDRLPMDQHVGSMKEAVAKAKAVAKTGDIILLSPGAASFNLFKNEFDRGEQFREEVRNL
ncbi:MAG: UDP-N-acetylmuramoyl-L-alanine--D-glutamate ligase [Patescibacteria group bacterium]|jgi:UDP-N-acetylmuramoylalanine--D-glutamate ligase